MIEFNEHLENSTLRRYQYLQLLPAELLKIDDHLSVCEYCRQRVKQTQTSAELYQSFFQPELLTEKKRFSLVNYFLSGWVYFSRPINKSAFVSAASLIFMLIFAFLFFNQKTTQETVVTNQIEQSNLIVNKEDFVKNEVNTNFVSNRNKPKNFPAIISKSKITNENVIKPYKIGSQKITHPNVKKNMPQPLNLSVELSEIKSDSSQTVGSNTRLAANTKTNLKITKFNGKFFVSIESDEKAVSYQYYLAEIPKLITVSKENSPSKTWQLPLKKLKKDKLYALQVTIITNDNNPELIQKTINIRQKNLIKKQKGRK